MRDPTRVQVTGLLAPYAEGFRGELTELGYGRDTTALQLWLMDHLSRWLEGRGLDGTGLAPGMVAAFVAERRAAGGGVCPSPLRQGDEPASGLSAASGHGRAVRCL